MIVVTGAAGFIGSALIAALNRKGLTDILAVDALDTSAKWKNFYGLSFVDYLDKDDFLAGLQENQSWVRAIEGIIHMGACSSTTEQDAAFMMKNNYEYSKQVALWCLQHKKKLLYASSAATYGDGALGFSDDHAKLNTLRPLNIYGYSKHLFDLWMSQKGFLAQCVGVKYFNVFGPNEYHKGEMRSMVLKAYYQIHEHKRIKLFKSHRAEYKDGEQKRDFVYIKDAVQMTLFLWEHKHAAGIYNIGSGNASTWNMLATAVFKALKLPVQIEYVDMPESVRDQYQYYTRADMAKVRDTGYRVPLMPLDVAISEYVQEYLMKDRYLGEA